MYKRKLKLTNRTRHLTLHRKGELPPWGNRDQTWHLVWIQRKRKELYW